MRTGTVVFDRILNVLTIFLLLLVIIGVVRSESKAIGSPATQVPKPGTKLAVDGVDWRKNQKTLLLVLGSKCPYCENNAPFHRSIVAHPSAGVHQMAVFGPQDTRESAGIYLMRHGIGISDVRILPLKAVRARGTPTVELVDGTGTVIKSWLGELDESGQGEVEAALQPDSWFSRQWKGLRGLLGSHP